MPSQSSQSSQSSSSLKSSPSPNPQPPRKQEQGQAPNLLQQLSLAKPIEALLGLGGNPLTSIRSIEEILEEVAKLVGQEGNLKRAIQLLLREKVNGAITKAESQNLAFNILKVLENSMGEQVPLSPEARKAYGIQMAQNFSLQCAEIANKFMELATAQGDLEIARHSPEEGAARSRREEAEEEFVKTFKNIGRLAPSEPK